MVRLTATLCKYIPDWYHLKRSGGSYFKKQNLFYLTRFYRKTSWSCHKPAMNRYFYNLQGEQFNAKQKSQDRRDINRMRIAAACEEHDFKYQLAIYEPRTFKSLVEICRQVTSDPLPDDRQISFKHLE